MASEYAPIDLTEGTLPDLAELAEEVRRTNRPRVLRRADEDIAVIAPISKPAKPARKPAAPTAGPRRYTLEQAFGAVPIPPRLQEKDIDEMVREAAEERAIRSYQGGIVAATAGRMRTDQPARSAEELRRLAEEAIADDVIERS